MGKEALKADLIVVSPLLYDEGLHERFVEFLQNTGLPQARIAGMMGRSTAGVSQYVNKVFKGDLPLMEKDVASLLRREMDHRYPVTQASFVMTSVAQASWEVLQFCDQEQDMGVVYGPAGVGKTSVINEYRSQNRFAIQLTLDITTRSLYAVLPLLAQTIGVNPHRNNSNTLHKIISQLKGTKRIIIIDEAQFLKWEAFEALRKIHDCAGVGMVYFGMPRLFDQMRSTTETFDQIFSRIGMRRMVGFETTKGDVKLLADHFCPGLSKDGMAYLHQKAGGPGRYRTMVKLVQKATKMAGVSGNPIDLEMLKEADKLLMI